MKKSSLPGVNVNQYSSKA